MLSCLVMFVFHRNPFFFQVLYLIQFHPSMIVTGSFMISPGVTESHSYRGVLPSPSDSCLGLFLPPSTLTRFKVHHSVDTVLEMINKWFKRKKLRFDSRPFSGAQPSHSMILQVRLRAFSIFVFCILACKFWISNHAQNELVSFWKICAI